MTTRNYRLRIADPGATEVSESNPATVDLTFKKDAIKNDGFPETWGSQNVRPLEGMASSKRFTIQIIDENSQVTSNLSDSSGHPDLLERLADFSIEDDGGGWEVVATGRVLNVTNPSKNPSYYEIEFGDELQRMRGKEVFEDTKSVGSTPVELVATTSIWPAGIRKDWENVTRIDDLQGVVTQVQGNIVSLTIPNIFHYELVDELAYFEDKNGRRTALPEVTREVIEDDLRPNRELEELRTEATEGDFHHLVFRDTTNGVDRPVRAVGIFGEGDEGEDPEVGYKADVEGKEVRVIKKINIVWPSGQPATDDNISGYLYMPGRTPSKNVPIHVGGQALNENREYSAENGLHPLDWCRTLLDLIDVNYNDTQISNKIAERKDSPRIWPRITGPVDVFREMSRVLKTYGYFPVINKSGEIEFYESIFPTANTIPTDGNGDPDITLLPQYDKDNIDFKDGQHPSLRIKGGDHIKTVIKLKFPADNVYLGKPFRQMEFKDDFVPDDRERDASADMIYKTQERYTRKADRNTDKFGKRTLELDFKHMMAAPSSIKPKPFADSPFSLTAHIGEAYLDRYSWGKIKTRLKNLPNTIDPSPGSLVRLDLSTYPNMEAQNRSGTRILQVLDNAYSVKGREVALLDAGPEQQPLPDPTITATATGPHTIEVTVGGSGGTSTNIEGFRYTVEAAIGGSSTPPVDSPKWETVYSLGGGSVGGDPRDITKFPANNNVYLRARQYDEDRITSDYSNVVSVTTDPLSAPTGITKVRDLGCAMVVEVTPGNTSLPLRLFVDGTRVSGDLAAGTVTKLLVNLSTSTTYTVEAQHIGRYGGVSSLFSTDLTTQSTEATGPPAAGIFGIVGNEP